MICESYFKNILKCIKTGWEYFKILNIFFVIKKIKKLILKIIPNYFFYIYNYLKTLLKP